MTKLTIVLCAALAGQASAQKQPARGRADDVERLEAKLEEQRQLLIRILQTQHLQLRQTQETLEMLLASLGGEAPSPPARATPTVDKPQREVTPRPATAVKKGVGQGSVVGRVALKGGGNPGDVVVYIADVREPARRGAAEMKQLNKQFVPGTLVVQAGTRVDFPNLDPVFHNVFSVTPGSVFDLGNYRKGEEPKGVVMGQPGYVKVYCNMHPHMVGHILVVPSSHHVSVGKDGFYRLANVPAGKRMLAAWLPNSQPVVKEIDVIDGEVITVELDVAAGKVKPHTNKHGQSYGSYKE